MENQNKFKVVEGITVLDCSTPYMFSQTKKYISDKYKGLGIADLFKSYAPAASLTEKGAVKMAGKVDALADDATLVQAVDRLNTLIAYLKSAGLMSEN